MGGEGEVGGGSLVGKETTQEETKTSRKGFQDINNSRKPNNPSDSGEKQEKEGCWNALTRGFLKRQVGRGSVGMLSPGDS